MAASGSANSLHPVIQQAERKQIYNQHVMLSFAADAQNIEVRINVPFHVGKIVFNPVVVSRTAVNNDSFLLQSDLNNSFGGGNTIGVVPAGIIQAAPVTTVYQSNAKLAGVIVDVANADPLLSTYRLYPVPVSNISAVHIPGQNTHLPQLPIITAIAKNPLNINGMYRMWVRSFTEASGGAPSTLTALVWMLIEFHEA